MMTKLNIRQVDLGSLFKVGFFIYGCLGLIAGLLYAFAMILLGGIGSAFLEDELSFGVIGGVLALVLVPVIAFVYGALGSIFITVIGILFNLVTRVTGGVKFDVEVAQPAPPAAPAPPPPPVPPVPPA